MEIKSQLEESERMRKALLSVLEDQKLAAKSLKESEERYALVIEAIEQGLWDWKVEKNEIYFSPQWKKQIGYEDNELENKFETWLEHLHPEDKDRCVSTLNDYLNNPVGYFQLEFRLRHKDGSYRYISNKAACIKDEENKVIRMFGAHTDITEKKLQEIEQSEQQKLLEIQRKILVETATSKFVQNGDIKNLSAEITEKVSELLNIERVSVWLFEKSEKILECIDLYEKSKHLHSSGYQLEQEQFRDEFEALKSSKYVDASEPLNDPRTAGYVSTYLIPLNITSMLDSVIKKTGRNFGTLCFEHVNKQHKWNQHEINFASQLADQIAICIINHEKLEAEQKLRESETRYRLIAENTADTIAVFDLNLNHTYVSPSVYSLLGYTTDEVMQLGLKNILTEDSYTMVLELLKKELEIEYSGKGDPNRYFTFSSKEICKNGSIIDVESVVSYIRDENGNATNFLAVSRDVTLQNQLKRELKEQEERMRLLIEGTSYFFFYTHNADGNVTYVSPSVEKITGHAVKDWLNQSHWFVTESPINKDAQQHTRKMLQGVLVPNPFYLEIFNSKNEKILLELYESPIYRDNEIVGLQGIAHDVTEKNRLYEKIKILSSAIEQSPFSVVITDANGKIEYVNPSFTKITGYTNTEAIGKNPRLLKSGMHDNNFYKNLWNMITSGQTWKGEIFNKKKDGNFYWANTIISPVFHERKKISHFVGIGEDITTKKELNDKLIRSEEEFRSIWENSIDAMRLIDEEGIVSNVNDAYCELFGITKDKLIGRPFNVSYIITDEDKTLNHYKEKFRKKTIERKFETQIKLHSGKLIWVELTNSFIEMGKGKPLLLSIFRDVTERKNLINDLVEAREKAEASDKLKSEFLAQISHEIRSPLNVIINYNSLLKNEYGELQKDELDDAFNGISNSSQRIIRTIDLILNSSEMQLGTYTPIFETIDVFDKIVQKSYNEMKRLAESRKLELKLEKLTDKTFIKCDEYSVFQSVINLVDNAIKYTKKGGIEIRLLRNANKKLQIEVSDTGIGMSEQYMSKLFQPFSQEDTGYTRKFEGTGLGLSLVKKYCDLNNIEISVKSKKDVGTTFTLTFNS